MVNLYFLFTSTPASDTKRIEMLEWIDRMKQQLNPTMMSWQRENLADEIITYEKLCRGETVKVVIVCFTPNIMSIMLICC